MKETGGNRKQKKRKQKVEKRKQEVEKGGIVNIYGKVIGGCWCVSRIMVCEQD